MNAGHVNDKYINCKVNGVAKRLKYSGEGVYILETDDLNIGSYELEFFFAGKTFKKRFNILNLPLDPNTEIIYENVVNRLNEIADYEGFSDTDRSNFISVKDQVIANLNALNSLEKVQALSLIGIRYPYWHKDLAIKDLREQSKIWDPYEYIAEENRAKAAGLVALVSGGMIIAGWNTGKSYFTKDFVPKSKVQKVVIPAAVLLTIGVFAISVNSLNKNFDNLWTLDSLRSFERPTENLKNEQISNKPEFHFDSLQYSDLKILGRYKNVSNEDLNSSYQNLKLLARSLKAIYDFLKLNPLKLEGMNIPDISSTPRKYLNSYVSADYLSVELPEGSSITSYSAIRSYDIFRLKFNTSLQASYFNFKLVYTNPYWSEDTLSLPNAFISRGGWRWGAYNSSEGQFLSAYAWTNTPYSKYEINWGNGSSEVVFTEDDLGIERSFLVLVNGWYKVSVELTWPNGQIIRDYKWKCVSLSTNSGGPIDCSKPPAN